MNLLGGMGGGYRIGAAIAIPKQSRASHSQRRIQAIDHRQCVLFLVEIVGLGLNYRVTRILPSVCQRFGAAKITRKRGFAGAAR